MAVEWDAESTPSERRVRGRSGSVVVEVYAAVGAGAVTWAATGPKASAKGREPYGGGVSAAAAWAAAKSAAKSIAEAIERIP